MTLLPCFLNIKQRQSGEFGRWTNIAPTNRLLIVFSEQYAFIGNGWYCRSHLGSW